MAGPAVTLTLPRAPEAEEMAIGAVTALLVRLVDNVHHCYS